MLPYFLYTILLMASTIMANELGLVSIHPEANREKCFKEQLPQNTVALFKYEGVPYIPPGKAPSAVQQVDNFQTQVTVRDANNNVVSTKIDKPSGRLFFTAPTSGEFQVCFKALQKHGYNPNSVLKLSPEIFIGDAGDPHITPPVALQLSDLSRVIMKANELVGDIEREQALQRVLNYIYLLFRNVKRTFKNLVRNLIVTPSSGPSCKL